MVEAFYHTCILLVETSSMKRVSDLMFGTGIDSSMFEFGVPELHSKEGRRVGEERALELGRLMLEYGCSEGWVLEYS